jgi:Protease inhibitor Inh
VGGVLAFATVAIRDSVMTLCPKILAFLVALTVSLAQAEPAPPPASDAVKDVVGNWEISNAERDKRCPATFSADEVSGGFKIELDPVCATAFPALKDVVAWMLGPNDVVRLVDGKGAPVLDLTEVESGMYEGERRGEGLYFMQAQAALKPELRTPEQMFGDWRLLRELDKPLCTLTLSNAAEGSGGETYKLLIKQGCDAAIAGLGLATWRLDRDQLVLSGRGGTWRFSESDPTVWERIPLSTDPILLMRP